MGFERLTMILLTALFLIQLGSDLMTHWIIQNTKQRTLTGHLLAGKPQSDQVMSDQKALSKYKGKD